MLACKDSGYDWFEQLLQNVSCLTCWAVLISQLQLVSLYDSCCVSYSNSYMVTVQLLKSEQDASYKPAKKACVQLVDNLVEHILKYEESLAGNKNNSFLACKCCSSWLLC